MKETFPNSLNKWLLFLKDKKLPVKDAHLTRLKKQIKNADALDKMQDNIVSEPMLSFAILNEASRMIANKNNDITSPVHAAAIVGINGLTRLLPNFSSYHLNPALPSPHLTAFLSEVQTSYEAACIAKRWATQKRLGNTDGLFWITLYKDVARWLLWLYAYPIMIEIDQRVKQGERASDVERRLLGCRIDEITTHLFMLWNTPHKIIEAFLTKNVPNANELQALAHLAHEPTSLPNDTDDKRLIFLINNPLILSYCANKVAHEAHLMRWDSKHLPFFYRVVAASTHCLPVDVIQLTHKAATDAAHLYNVGGKAPLAQQLLDPELYKSLTPTSPKKPDDCPITSLKRRLGKHDLYDTKQKAHLALSALKKSLSNAQHCILFALKKNQVSPLFQLGYETKALKSIKWNAPSSAFAKLSKKPAAAHFFGAKLNKVLKELPHTADQLIDKNSHLVLLSTPMSENEMLLFWLETNETFNQEDYKKLKKIASIIRYDAT
ncbi:HDOD domain-containing protein [Marinomonas algarum]|uniref:HDOD domain-containing protein n=1 Tax=Marinomonas algarum TaxID=2883105 RepID=A0A9X1ILF3_9GAMM|nr:HDOD domain-containing protein [Marinomonas algarum]MCB5161390.1 HDOD domain-containing protein [Marinomonas algarum]